MFSPPLEQRDTLSKAFSAVIGANDFGIIGVSVEQLSDSDSVAAQIGAAAFDFDIWNRIDAFELQLARDVASLTDLQEPRDG